VLVLEDLHWADEATLDLLRLIGRRVERTGSLIVATFRDDEVDAGHPLRLVLGGLAGSPAVERLALEPLSLSAVRVLAVLRDVEYVVDRKAWHDAGNSKPPKLFGRTFGLTTKNPFGLEPFYALHAWVWKENPAGWLQPWNPSVSCRRRSGRGDPPAPGALVAPGHGRTVTLVG